MISLLFALSFAADNVPTETGDLITLERTRNDEHGNTVELVGPMGEVDGTTHRRVWTYEPFGLRVLSVDLFTEGPEGPYALRQEYTYETLFDKVASASNCI